MQAIILAAGKGTRLQPLTLQRSKAMAPIVGQPIVQRVMETLIPNGIRDFIVVANPADEEVQDYLQNRATLDVTVQFVFQAKRRGMAHALGLAAPLINGPFLLSACDNLTPVEHIADLLATHRSRRAEATLSLMEVEPHQVEQTGIVAWQGERIRRIVEKPTLAEAPSNISSLPLYVFSPTILDYLPEVNPSPRGEYELQDAIQLLIDRGHLVTGAITRHRLQLTNAGDLLALNRYYLFKNAEGGPTTSPEVGPNTRLVPPVYIEERVTIGAGCTIGPGVTIEAGCHIEDHVFIKNAVVLRNTTIATGRRVVDEVVMA